MLNRFDKKLSAAIVLYENDPDSLLKTINDALNCAVIERLFLIDNSKTNRLEKLVSQQPSISYYFQNANLGFGKAHNIAFEKAISEGFNYHLILNPDIQFSNQVCEQLIAYLGKHSDTGLIMPKILNFDGSNQFLPKLLPSIFSQIIRMFGFLKNTFKTSYENYVLQAFENQIANVPIISGCFCIYNLSIFNKIGGFDERFFMYCEDFDLSRRVHKHYKTIYYPNVSVYHGYEKASRKSFKLLKIHIQSIIKYYNKYGWFFDSDRVKINKLVLSQFKK